MKIYKIPSGEPEGISLALDFTPEQNEDGMVILDHHKTGEKTSIDLIESMEKTKIKEIVLNHIDVDNVLSAAFAFAKAESVVGTEIPSWYSDYIRAIAYLGDWLVLPPGKEDNQTVIDGWGYIKESLLKTKKNIKRVTKFITILKRYILSHEYLPKSRYSDQVEAARKFAAEHITVTGEVSVVASDDYLDLIGVYQSVHTPYLIMLGKKGKVSVGINPLFILAKNLSEFLEKVSSLEKGWGGDPRRAIGSPRDGGTNIPVADLVKMI